MKLKANKLIFMDFFIATIIGFLLLFNSSGNFEIVNRAKTAGEGMSANHLVPAKRIIFPYRPNGAVFFDQKELSAKAATVFDENTGQVLFQKDGYGRRPIASLTKLMSILIWFDINGNLDQEVEIKSDDYRDGSIPYFVAGDKVKTKDLLYAGLIASSNSAIAALVRSSGSTMDDFTRLMNEKAQKMGMKDTVFVEPTGLDSGNISTAIDLFILVRGAFRIPEISEATRLKSYSFAPQGGVARFIKSTNWLLGDNSGYKILGGKTGYIEESNYNLALEVGNKNNDNLIILVLGAPDAESRFSEAKKLFEWAYTSYIWEM